ncbi:MAG TPA: LysM domain-containing protein [Gaiellaceae bacterium]|nr:LysM domain-containing protein [Gaiellaceae bacterium]
MVTIPFWFIRYGLPTALLLAATVAVLLVRAAVYDDPPRPAVNEAPAPKIAPSRVRTRAARVSAYSVRSGDTLGTIAGRFGTTVEKLLVLNPGIDPRALRVGRSLRVE